MFLSTTKYVPFNFYLMDRCWEKSNITKKLKENKTIFVSVKYNMDSIDLENNKIK